MSKTGMAIETIKRCLETGDPTGGIEALERVTERLLEVLGELAQLKRRVGEERAAEWSREFEAGLISLDEVGLVVVSTQETTRQPHAEECGDHPDNYGGHETPFGRRDE